MHTVLQDLGRIGIVPVIKIDDAKKAIPLAKALAAGGISCAELTFRTSQAEEAITLIKAHVPDMLVGAGTVLTTDQVDRAVGAGAQFIVSPGLNPKIVAYCIQKGIPIAPGCSNPSDIEQALEFGLDLVKFFPAEQAGGLNYIKAISAPYPTLKFMPTGGINAGNIAAYSTFEKIHACGGSWMVSPELVNAGDFDEITALSREAVQNMLGFTVAHIGINAGDAGKAMQAASLFTNLFGFPVKDGSSSVFSGDTVELVKTSAPGAHGHIAIATNSIYRAAAWLERNNRALDHANAKKDSKGNTIALYLKDDILGFAVHLLQKK